MHPRESQHGLQSYLYSVLLCPKSPCGSSRFPNQPTRNEKGEKKKNPLISVCSNKGKLLNKWSWHYTTVSSLKIHKIPFLHIFSTQASLFILPISLHRNIILAC